MGSLPGGSSVLPEESSTSQGFPLTELHTKKKSDPDSQDDSDTEDDEGDDDDDGQDDQDEDDDEDEDEPGKDSEDGGDPEDEPEANGDGGSDDDGDATKTKMKMTTTTMMWRRRRRRRTRKIFPSHQLRGGNEAKVNFFLMLFYLFLLGWEFGLNRERRLGGFRVSYLHHGKKDWYLCGHILVFPMFRIL
ncbi:hypothetical protein OIU79_011376 [Salix purpurea]|uniref:Uncharacterized protein n=1 Tax=Salix purpurea TaxID=77065 RepID=A0A9Q0Q159_SALPP|nr:hypothetical protein OIU79_011376 [Salix purpurea]